MKLLFTLKSPDHSGLDALHRLVLQGLESQVSDIQMLADQILAGSESLTKSGQLRKHLLTISIHKVKSIEWNTLMVKYIESPNRYQAEIKKEKPQTTLF